jgi:hypothetical protein
MAGWSEDLKVGGYCKIGYPGLLILEGESAAVQQYVVLLRSLRWKAMAVRGEQAVRACFCPHFFLFVSNWRIIRICDSGSSM